MSVAASLAELRRSVKRPVQRPTSVARSELAASARNALLLLQRSDPALESLLRPLLLLSPELDRLTLSPDAQRDLSAAVVEMVRRLAPVFLLRSAHSVLEWLVVALSLPTHGSDQEYDELLIAALPFSERIPFVRLLKSMAPLRPKWGFLAPVVQQSKPLPLTFFVNKMPTHLFPIIIHSAMCSASKHIHTTSISSFLANILTRRILVPLDAPSLTLSCIQTLRKLTSTKFLKRVNTLPTNLISAMLSALAVAMSAAHVESPVLQAASHACAFVLLNCKLPQLQHAAASCLVLTSSSHTAFVPSKVARTLLNSPQLDPQLKLLHASDASSLYAALVRASVGGKPDKIPWSRLEHAISNSSLLNAHTVRKLVIDLLRKVSLKCQPEPFDIQSAVEGLASVIAPLARGCFAEAVDSALKHHFQGRKGKGTDRRYCVVDKALAKALHGTQFAMVSTAGEMPSLSFSAALDHPEPSVRRAALCQFAKGKELSWCSEPNALQSILVRFTEMVRLEDDLEMVNMACDCLLRVSPPENWHPVLATLVTRYVGTHEKLKERNPKKKKLARKLDLLNDMFLKMLKFCDSLGKQNPSDIHALLTGIVIAGYLPHSVDKDYEKKMRDFLSQHWKELRLEHSREETTEKDIKLCVRTAVTKMLSRSDIELVKFCDALETWKRGWILDASCLWLKHLEKGAAPEKSERVLRCVLQLLARCVKAEALLLRPVVLLLVKYCRLFCQTSSSLGNASTIVADSWLVVASDANDQACQKFLRTVVSEINLTACLKILRGACLAAPRQDVKVKSLKWYTNICIAHPTEEVRKEAMVLLMRLLYGDDIELQKSALEISKIVSNKDGSKKHERRTELWSFLTLVSNLPKYYKWEPQGRELERMASMNIQKRIIGNIKTPPPLLYAKQQLTGNPLRFDNLLLNLSQEKENWIVANAHLRALHGYRIQTVEQCSFIISLLSSQLQGLLSVANDQNIFLESIARMAQILLQAPVDILSQTPSLTNLSTLTISQLKILSPKAISPDDFCEKLLTVLLSLSAVFVDTHKESPMNLEHRTQHLGYLFAVSSMSSRLGMSTRRNVDIVCRSSVSDEELATILKTRDETQGPAVKRQKGSKDLFQEFREMSREACRGILEAMLRWTSKNGAGRYPCLSGSLDTLKSCLFDLFMSSSALLEEPRSSTDEMEYELSLLLQVQTSLYKIQPSRISRVLNVNAIAEKAQYVRDGSKDTPVASAVRRNAITLLEVLAPIYGAEMQEVLAPVIESLVAKGNLSTALSSLEAFVPALIESGCDFEKICLWIVESAYSNGSLFDSEKGQVLLSSCCRLVPDSPKALMTVLRRVDKRLAHCDSDNVAQICTAILLDVQMSVFDDIDSIRTLPARIRCRTAYSVLQSPVFISKVFTSAHTLSNEEELANSFSSLFIEILVCDDTNGRRDSVAAIVAILPLHVFEKCVVQGLNSKDAKIRCRTMDTVRERFEAEDAPLTYTWKMDEVPALNVQEMSTIELSFLSEVGKILCSICMGKFSFFSYEERILAGLTLGRLVAAMGSSQRQTVLSFAGVMVELVRNEKVSDLLSCVQAEKAECQLRATCLELFGIFVGVLGKYAVPFIPTVLSTASEVIDKVFNPKQSFSTSPTALSMLICISEAAIKLITAVLDSCPLFLGTRVLQGLITLNFCSEADVLSDLLSLAMRKAAPGTISLAFSKAVEKLNECNASPLGLSRVIRALSGGLDEMDKGEVRLHMGQILQSITSCLDHGRDEPRASPTAEAVVGGIVKNPSPGSIDALLSEYRDVDHNSADALTSVVLKLPESKFKELFNGLLQWCDGGSISVEALSSCETFGVEVTPNVTRATPFYRVVLRFFEKLQVIMIPYVFQLLENILKHVSRKKSEIRRSDLEKILSEPSQRKRKRSEMEVESQLFTCEVLTSSEERLNQCCLEIITFLLKQKLEVELFTSNVATKIQDSLLSAFDNSYGESESVRQALCSLALRITACGKASDSREESRGLLISLARSLLQRTREASARVRAGALRVSCEVAQAVGDEYLVTLPESMPVLSEVIDDEQKLVQKEAKRFVRVMEGLAGESIMDQLT
ncbi:unnamed protein product [Agarophyton chilense]